MVLGLFVVCSFTACSDSNFPIEEGSPSGSVVEGFDKGYSLNVKITLDDMGGTRAVVNTPQELKQWEDYIDPEKIRILFFDHQDLFLFESKSRWVKQLDNNEWLISVPIFTYGNDVYEDKDGGEWNWELIRKALTSNPFKIAILANRPEMEWYPGFNDLTLPAQYIDNTGPDWKPNDTRKKSVFDLHHCQYDPLYHAKSKSTGFYDFIMGDYYKEGNGIYDNYRPQMGATSSWLEWQGSNEHKWTYTSNQKEKEYVNYRLPSQDHPIPMYGIQRFEQIDPDDWQEGTPFNLSDNIPGVGPDVDGSYKDNRKSIWLLRSVVKLELLIPKTETVGVVSINYPNPYSRCEPMDVWTPTDDLWNGQHGDEGICEIESILKYGTICKKTDAKSSTKQDYQNRIAWLYGAWLDNNPAIEGCSWWFNKEKKVGMEDKTGRVSYPQLKKEPQIPYPRIFNPCIQRNTSILCENSDVTDFYDDDGYYHYVVYTGERNVNDPSDLGKLGDDGGGKPTVQYWGVCLNEQYYAFPITNYAIKDNPALEILEHLDSNPAKEDGENTPLTQGWANGKQVDGQYVGYSQTIMAYDGNNPKLLPWPLIRNHVYTLKLTPRNGDEWKNASQNRMPSQNTEGGTNRISEETGNSDFIITLEDNYTKRVNPD